MVQLIFLLNPDSLLSSGRASDWKVSVYTSGNFSRLFFPWRVDTR